MISAYFKLVVLPDEVKAIHKIRSKQRLDCISFFNDTEYKGLTYFVNDKGQMFLYKNQPENVIEGNRKRRADTTLTFGSINFSSIYIEDLDFPQYGYGYPNAHRTLKDGSPNPLYPFSNDAYLFIINKDYTQIEILVVSEGRNLITGFYQKLIDGGLEEILKHFREFSIPFFNYGFNSKL